MRFYEIVLLLLDLAVLLGPLLPTRVHTARINVLPWMAFLVMGVHLVFEGYRWQMVLAYALTVLLLLLSLRPNRAASAPHAASRWRWVRGGLSLLLIALTAALPVIFPVPQLPAPPGAYAIGTVSYDWIDPARAEHYGNEPNAKREIMVQAWYPAESEASAPTAPWMERLEVAAPRIATYLRLPGFVLDHVGLVRTHSYASAPLSSAEARYPVIVYSHGWNGFRANSTNQMEALASEGYVVFAIDHTYGAMLTVFPDGRVVLNNPKALPADGTPEAEAQPIREALVATYAADVRFVLDQLEKLNAGEIDSRWAGRLDLDRVGIFGHSTGGGGIVLACSLDVRCKAGLGMDAWVVPVPDSVIAGGLAQPFLFMRSEVWREQARNDPRLDQLFAHLKQGGYRLTITGTRHYDFTLVPLLTPLAPALGLKGPIDGARGMQIVTDYLLAFFDQTLKGKLSALLAGPAAQYPDVMFEQRGP
jgi:predicted dienelactone hydrolase